MMAVLAWLAVGLFGAVAARDAGWRVIDNGLVLALLATWGLFAVLSPLAWGQIGVHLAIGGGAFTVLLLAYALGGIGGGDVKLAAPVFFWAGPENGMAVLLVIGLAGGGLAVLGLVCDQLRRLPLPECVLQPLLWLSAKRGVPYGIALATGGALAALAANSMVAS